MASSKDNLSQEEDSEIQSLDLDRYHLPVNTHEYGPSDNDPQSSDILLWTQSPPIQEMHYANKHRYRHFQDFRPHLLIPHPHNEVSSMPIHPDPVTEGTIPCTPIPSLPWTPCRPELLYRSASSQDLPIPSHDEKLVLQFLMEFESDEEA